MSGDPPVLLEVDGPVLVATIDHPPVNAISLAVIAALEAALAEAVAGGECRAVVITGAGGRSFSGGADLGEVAAQGEALRRNGRRLTRALEQSPLPVIAAVNGAAMGGGCELALAADVRIASSNARFGQPEIRLGIIPGWGGTQRLSRLIGPAAALPLLLSGDAVDAQRALELGLVSRVVEAGDLRREALELAGSLARQAPLAVAAVKRLVRAGLDLPLDAALDLEDAELAALVGSQDAVEGVLAFLEKRPPRWRGG